MLEQFPRPANDNGRGVHWSHSTTVWGKPDWGFWAEQIQELQIKWVKMIDPGDGASIGLAKRLVDMGVMPVVRFYREEPNPDRINDREIEAARRYIDWGAVYFETNNEPDLALEWEGRRRPDNWLEIVVDNFIIEADQIRELGGYLLFPAFGPGGRGNPFQMIVDRGRRDILDGNCGLAIHNYCLGRPLDYPNDPVNTQGAPLTLAEWEERGGLWAWEMDHNEVNRYRREVANPNASIMEDSTCFRAFEYFDALVNEAVGHSIPIFTTEGGYNVGQRAGTTFGDDSRYAKPTPEWAGQLTRDMFRYIQEEGPDYYFACMPWLIAVQRIGNIAVPFENQGPWYTHQFDAQFGLNGELPIVRQLKALPSQVVADGPIPESWQRYQKLVTNSERVFDPRLQYLAPTPFLTPTADPTAPHWKLVEARWGDRTEGNGYIYVKAMDESGQPMEGARFAVDRGDAIDEVVTKGPIDGYFGNYLMTAPLGTFIVRMADDGLPSDELGNLGRGEETEPTGFDTTGFFLTFQRVSSAITLPALLLLPPNFAPRSLAYQADLLAVSGQRDIQFWNPSSQVLLRELNGHRNLIWQIALNQAGTRLASASWDRTVKLWDATNGNLLHTFAHPSWVATVTFSPDGTQLATAGADRTIRLWSVETGLQSAELTGHDFQIWQVVFSPDGQQLASVSGDNSVRLWSVGSRQAIAVLQGHAEAVLRVAFSPDGQRLISSSVDGTVRLWDVNTQAETAMLVSEDDAIYALAIDLTSDLVAVGHLDGRIELWEMGTGQRVRQFDNHSDAVRDLVFQPEGRVLISVSGDGTVRFHPV